MRHGKRQRAGREAIAFLLWAGTMGALVFLTLDGWRPLQAWTGLPGDRGDVVSWEAVAAEKVKPGHVPRCEDKRDRSVREAAAGNEGDACLHPDSPPVARVPSLVRIQECREGYRRAVGAKRRELTDAELVKACPLLRDVHEQVHQLITSAVGSS